MKSRNKCHRNVLNVTEPQFKTDTSSKNITYTYKHIDILVIFNACHRVGSDLSRLNTS